MDGLIITGVAALVGKITYDIAGPFAKELGEMVTDHLRPYRDANQKKIMEKTVQKIADADLRANTVHPKILMPVMEYGGLEDDDFLQDRWASLLANASVSQIVHPAFVEILRQLSSNDVKFLDAIFNNQEEKRGAKEFFPQRSQRRVDLLEIWQKTNETMHNVSFFMVVTNLERLGLIEKDYSVVISDKRPNQPEIVERSYFSELGLRFISACQPPKKKAQSDK